MELNDGSQFNEFEFENAGTWGNEGNTVDVPRIALGIECVHLLLIRYIKRQSLKPMNESNNYLLDKWYERTMLNNEATNNETDERFLELIKQRKLKRIEMYILLILYSFHHSSIIRDICITIRCDVRLMAFTQSLVLALLEDGSEHLSNIETRGLLEKSNDIVIVRDNPNGLSEEPELFLNKIIYDEISGDQIKSYFTPICFYSFLDTHTSYHVSQKHTELFDIIQAHLEAFPQKCLSVLLSGSHGIGKKTLAKSICHSLGLKCIALNTALLCSSKLSSYHRLFEEMTMYKGIILIPNADLILSSPTREAMLVSAIQQCHATLILTVPSRNACPAMFLSIIERVVDLTDITKMERSQIWKSLLPKRLFSVADSLATTYRLAPSKIQSAFHMASDLAYAEGKKLDRVSLERACRLVQQQSFEGLAVDSVSPSATLSRLVLATESMKEFERILAAARTHETVMVDWGFADHLTTGKGVCVLFDGPPGTGKTFAAEVLANELHRPLKRVHMPNLVSKWVGETGENIAKLFDAARTSNAIMLLDEADALISKRTEQSSKSTDRYANMEINILLQEIECYDGISILTTNLPKSLDPALERRIQFRITFKAPNETERVHLWHSLIPSRTPVDPAVDFNRIARRFELSGGNIKNAVLHAAYAACAENTIIQERHLTEAAESECRKLGLLVRQHP